MKEELTIDALRWEHRDELPGTGIFVRAKVDGKWESVDIEVLDQPSLRAWLKSRGGDNIWAENTVCLLLGHTIGEVRCLDLW